MNGQLRLRMAPGVERADAPTPERVRHAARQGGVARLASGGGVYVDDREGQSASSMHVVRYPLLIDYLRDAGRLSPADYDIAVRVRALYEQTDLRAHLTGAYEERTSRTTGDTGREEVTDKYRWLERRVLRRAGRDAWTALRAIVIEDRMTASAAALPAALREAERSL